MSAHPPHLGNEHPGHSHADHPEHGHRAFAWALLFTLGFAGVEATAGLWAHSLALVSDAGHMLTDSLSLGLAALATWLSRRPASARHSYGLARAEVMAALVNSLLMLALVTFIIFEAWQRFAQPRPVQGTAVFVVALIGLGVNVALGWLLMKGEDTLNRRAALLHVVGDALGSVAALVAGLVIMLTGWTPIDPILSVFISLLILASTLNLLRHALHVLMEGVPAHIDLNAVGLRLAQFEHVARVHDLHIWTLASGKIALSAHMDVRDLAHWPQILADAGTLLNREFGIGHITLQPEIIRAAPITMHASRPDPQFHDHAQ
ncbi:MAG: cation diffusion facilitator family transporter [Thiobacillaceae bacterium]